MLSVFAGLAMKRTPVPHRTVVTPGQLYRILSAEFRMQRPARCGCRMPMIAARSPDRAGDPNWWLESSAHGCASCRPVVAQMLSQYSQRYELSDP